MIYITLLLQKEWLFPQSWRSESNSEITIVGNLRSPFWLSNITYFNMLMTKFADCLRDVKWALVNWFYELESVSDPKPLIFCWLRNVCLTCRLRVYNMESAPNTEFLELLSYPRKCWWHLAILQKYFQEYTLWLFRKKIIVKNCDKCCETFIPTFETFLYVLCYTWFL